MSSNYGISHPLLISMLWQYSITHKNVRFTHLKIVQY